MSLSINELLKGVTDASKRILPKEGKLHNPDIPDGPLNPEVNIKDQYATVMRFNGPYNGSGLPLKEGGRLRMMNPRLVDFMSDSTAINPNNIRSKVDPDRAHPLINSNSLFSLTDSSVKPPHNTIGLVKRSRSSFANYKNRFNSKQASSAATAPTAPLSTFNAAKGSQPLDEPRARTKIDRSTFDDSEPPP